MIGQCRVSVYGELIFCSLSTGTTGFIVVSGFSKIRGFRCNLVNNGY